MSRSSSTTRMRSGNGVAEAAGGGEGVVGVKDGAAGDEDVGPGARRQGGRLLIDAAVDLQSDLEVAPVDLLSCLLDLVHHVGDEGLAAEAGVHGHQQQ